MPSETTLAGVSVGTTTWAPLGMVAAADNLAASAQAIVDHHARAFAA